MPCRLGKRVSRAFSFNKTPRKLKRAMSSMTQLVSPRHRDLSSASINPYLLNTPSSEFKAIRLATELTVSNIAVHQVTHLQLHIHCLMSGHTPSTTHSLLHIRSHTFNYTFIASHQVTHLQLHIHCFTSGHTPSATHSLPHVRSHTFSYTFIA